MGTLFWALFGLPDLDILDLRHANHTFTEGVGTGLYAVYHIIAIVVLMNVLIAMMSNTYTRIEVGFRMGFFVVCRLSLSFVVVVVYRGLCCLCVV